MKKNKKMIFGIGLAYIVILGIGYLGVAFYFSNHFLRGTTVNGKDCSNLTVEEVKKRVEENLQEYELKVEEIDGRTEKITAEALGLTYADNQKVEQLMEEQNQWAWVTAFFKKQAYELPDSPSYDASRLEQVMNEMSCFQEENIIAPKDAYVKEENGRYIIVPEEKGTTLDREKVREAIKEAIADQERVINLEELGCYELPEVTADDEDLKVEMEIRNHQKEQADLLLQGGGYSCI